MTSDPDCPLSLEAPTMNFSEDAVINMACTWFLVLTKNAMELSAREHLLNQKFDVFLPLEKRSPSKKANSARTYLPFFAGHLLS